jgi:hypothetical protein
MDANTINNDTLVAFQFLMSDGTICTVYASNQFEAARIARGEA